MVSLWGKSLSKTRVFCCAECTCKGKTIDGDCLRSAFWGEFGVQGGETGLLTGLMTSAVNCQGNKDEVGATFSLPWMCTKCTMCIKCVQFWWYCLKERELLQSRRCWYEININVILNEWGGEDVNGINLVGIWTKDGLLWTRYCAHTSPPTSCTWVLHLLYTTPIQDNATPTGRRNHGRPLKRLLDTWDRNGSTGGPTPWKIYYDDDELLHVSAIYPGHLQGVTALLDVYNTCGNLYIPTV